MDNIYSYMPDLGNRSMILILVEVVVLQLRDDLPFSFLRSGLTSMHRVQSFTYFCYPFPVKVSPNSISCPFHSKSVPSHDKISWWNLMIIFFIYYRYYNFQSLSFLVLVKIKFSSILYCLYLSQFWFFSFPLNSLYITAKTSCLVSLSTLFQASSNVTVSKCSRSPILQGLVLKVSAMRLVLPGMYLIV